MSKTDQNIIEAVEGGEYKYGFTSDIETDAIAKGLSEEEIGRAHV